MNTAVRKQTEVGKLLEPPNYFLRNNQGFAN